MEESLYILGLLNEDQLPEQSRAHLADHLPDLDTRFRIQDPQLVEVRDWILRRIKVHANYPQDKAKLKAKQRNSCITRVGTTTSLTNKKCKFLHEMP